MTPSMAATVTTTCTVGKAMTLLMVRLTVTYSLVNQATDSMVERVTTPTFLTPTSITTFTMSSRSMPMKVLIPFSLTSAIHWVTT
jgi:hypothetical protein